MHVFCTLLFATQQPSKNRISHKVSLYKNKRIKMKQDKYREKLHKLIIGDFLVAP